MKIKTIALHTVLAATAGFIMSGCSALQESMAAQMEVPTLEKQANRVAVGMTIVRENNIMALKMPISADAKWPALVCSDVNSSDKKFIDNVLKEEPYFATVHYTEPVQRKMLGSGALMSQLGDYGNVAAQLLNQTVTPLTYKAIKKIAIFYGPDTVNWPNVFNYDGNLSDFLDFKDGKMKDIEAATADVYNTLGEAVISLAPVNMQKDLTLSRSDMLDAFANTASIKAEKGELETRLKGDEARQNSEKDDNATEEYIPLTEEEKAQLNQDIVVADERIKEAESMADEKEKIYFELLDQAIVALESDINIDDENYVKLAKNINLVASEIQTGATEVYTSFGLVTSAIATDNIIQNFPKELRSLAIAKAYVPMHLQSKYDERLARLVKNSIYFLPNILIGTYYAHKQAVLAEKYENFTNIIIEAYNTKMEQEKEAQEAEEEAAKENS